MTETPDGFGRLLAPTPVAWVELACEQWRTLLIDHANCEKKAASTALALMFAYPEERRMAVELSRLAREELRHFEQVSALMRKLDVTHVRQIPGRYAADLRRVTRSNEPARRLDLLLVGSLIEARSCERFALLSQRLPPPLGDFYARLETAEARHAGLYLDLATDGLTASQIEHLQARWQVLAAAEANLVTSPDTQFRFHSGLPSPIST